MNSWKNQIVLKTLVPFVAAYLILCAVRAGQVDLQTLVSNWQSILAIGALAFGLSLFQDLFPKSWKEFLIFGRIKDRLPGHRAFDADRKFSDVIDRREVINIAERETMKPREQHRKFYRLYNQYRDSGAVSNSSYRYLQWRELSFTALVSAFAVLLIFVYNHGFLTFVSWELFAYGLATYALSVIAARRAASDLIDYVLLTEMLEKTQDDE